MFDSNLSGTRHLAGALLTALAFVLLSGTGSWSQPTYTVNGKPVPKNVYDAAVLAQEAAGFLSAGNLDRAAGKLRMALLCDPNFSSAHANLGIILARRGKNAEALLHLKKSIESPDSSPLSYMNLASFYQCTGNLDGAISTFKIFIERSSSNPEMTAYAESILKMLEKEKERQLKSGTSTQDQAESSDYFANLSGNPPARWSDMRMPLKVYIEPSSSAEGYNPTYQELLKQSFIDWEKATDKKVRFLFVPEKEGCDINCFWTDDPAKLGNGTENGKATTQSRAGVLLHAEIVLRTKAAPESFPLNDNTILSTCRHEVEHALGVSGHSPRPDDLMYFSVPMADREQNITLRDRNTVRKLYCLEIPWPALCLDFLARPGNLKNCLPILLVLFFVAALCFLLSRPKKKKKLRTR